MTFEEREKMVTGTRLSSYAWRPDGPVRGGVVLLHGLGDYLLRYEAVAHFFVNRGFACEGVDFPGHGKSPGQRGHIPSWEVLLRSLDESLERLRDLAGSDAAPLGLFAHSMGAYVSLDYLSQRPEKVRFAWLSSPLIQPSYGRPQWLLRLAEPLGKWLPRIPYDTGVRSADCVADGGKRTSMGELDRYLHHRTTLGFGRELVRREKGLGRSLQGWSRDLDLLVTHGTKDRVCPYELSRHFFAGLPGARTRFLPLEGERHEPLHGGGAERAFAAASKWLEEVASTGVQP